MDPEIHPQIVFLATSLVVTTEAVVSITTLEAKLATAGERGQ